MTYQTANPDTSCYNAGCSAAQGQPAQAEAVAPGDGGASEALPPGDLSQNGY